MDKSYKNKYYDLEDKHWWNISRREIIMKLLNPYFKKEAKILDIGCSSGALIKQIISNNVVKVYGIDISNDAINLSKHKGLKNVKTMDASKLEYADEEFDVVIASDVLEHIRSDLDALKEWKRVLKPNGKMILFVPAREILWSNNDIYSQHFRRYEKKQLKDHLIKSGFSISRLSYWNFLLFIPIFAYRKFQKTYYNVDMESNHELMTINPIIDSIFRFILFIENRVLTMVNFPIGVSLFAICKKK